MSAAEPERFRILDPVDMSEWEPPTFGAITRIGRTWLHTCSSCGAVVSEKERHVDYHRNLVETVAEHANALHDLGQLPHTHVKQEPPESDLPTPEEFVADARCVKLIRAGHIGVVAILVDPEGDRVTIQQQPFDADTGLLASPIDLVEGWVYRLIARDHDGNVILDLPKYVGTGDQLQSVTREQITVGDIPPGLTRDPSGS